MRILAMVVVLVAAMTLPAVAADDLPISAFYGKWSGSGKSSGMAGGFFDVSERDLDVTISAAGNGVRVAWTTFLRKGSDPQNQEVVKRAAKITFRAGGRPNVFIEKRGTDPFDDKPLSWARIDGRTLTTYTFVVDKDGVYSLSSYARTLARNGRNMELLFALFRDGERVRTARAKLVKK
ncbi:MAG: hypothetical protein GY791_03465 [Alphaproteobacteria bacterium]|nr:hypothetical protein [Alphaproteobacteria bacterium]